MIGASSIIYLLSCILIVLVSARLCKRGLMRMAMHCKMFGPLSCH